MKRGILKNSIIREIDGGEGKNLQAEEVYQEKDSYSVVDSEEELYSVIESFTPESLEILCLIICDLYYIICLYRDWQEIYRNLELIFNQILDEEGPFYAKVITIIDYLEEKKDTFN